ncbi:hypothetical protein DFH11DRAFT_730761 [Phellopilus nigrolimitatus]|nr:hypothetical protein DFH11DRAFT_730761 [Phellopilus nigrolimitatus]
MSFVSSILQWTRNRASIPPLHSCTCLSNSFFAIHLTSHFFPVVLQLSHLLFSFSFVFLHLFPALSSSILICCTMPRLNIPFLAIPSSLFLSGHPCTCSMHSINLLSCLFFWHITTQKSAASLPLFHCDRQCSLRSHILQPARYIHASPRHPPVVRHVHRLLTTFYPLASAFPWFRLLTEIKPLLFFE